MSREVNSDSSEGPLAGLTHVGGVQGMFIESMNEQLRNYVNPVKFNECQNLQNLNCDEKRRFIDFGACDNVYQGTKSPGASETKVEDKIDKVLLDIEKIERALGRGSTKSAEELLRETREDIRELGRALKPEECKSPGASETKAEDEIDEVLLDIEKIERALGRGSTKLAEEWLREAREDIRELERALKPGECGRHGQSEGDHPEAKPELPVKPDKPLDPDYPSEPFPFNPFLPGLPFPRKPSLDDPQPEPFPFNPFLPGLPFPRKPSLVDTKPEPHVKPEPLPFRPETLIMPEYSENFEPYENIDRSKPVEATVDQVLAQNDRSQNSVFPGENTDHFGWYGGRSLSGIDKPTTPESRFNYLMAWNMVYPEKGKEANPDARVEMQNFRTYVHTKDGQWLETLNQNESGIGGGLSPADFADMYAVYDAPIQNSAEGIASFDAPKPGFNFQPWIADRGHFDNQNVDGVYISGMVRSDRPDSNLVIDQGADWYEHEGGSAVNTSDGVGTSNWLRISEDWQPLFYSNVSEEELRRNPPPGITS